MLHGIGFVNNLEDLGLLTLAQINLVIRKERDRAEIELINARMAKQLRQEQPPKIRMDFKEEGR